VLVVAGAVVAAGLVAIGCGSAGDGAQPGSTSATPPVVGGDAVFALAYEKRATDVEVEGQGTVVRLLPDDVEGERHQRFIVRLDSGQTLLIAHNIDVAPRVEDLRVGDVVSFRGVYEWNEEGGTVHWTHQDPDGEHAPGWIRAGGRVYQ
jgi:Protein of unknown function (DUF3465)